MGRVELLPPHRRARAVGGSLIVHAGLAWLLIAVPAPASVVAPPPPIDVEIVPAPPAAAPAPSAAMHSTPGTATPGRGATVAGPIGRRGRAVRARPAEPEDPLAGLAVTYEAPPGAGTGARASGPGDGLFGDGTGAGLAGPFGSGNGGMLRIPLAPKHPSRARPPRPRHDYTRWPYRWPEQYGDARVLVELTIDARGAVIAVRVVHGFNRDLDERAAGFARAFEFVPALDDDGIPTVGLHRWEFVIEPRPIDFVGHFRSGRSAFGNGRHGHAVVDAMEAARASNLSLVAIIVGSAAVFSALGHALPPPDAPRYYAVDELAGAHDGDAVKVRGFVRAGSIERSCTEVRFVLEHGGHSLRVVAHGPAPVRNQAEVVVTGHLIGGALDGTAVMKCESGYRDAVLDRRAPHFE